MDASVKGPFILFTLVVDCIKGHSLYSYTRDPLVIDHNHLDWNWTAQNTPPSPPCYRDDHIAAIGPDQPAVSVPFRAWNRDGRSTPSLGGRGTHGRRGGVWDGGVAGVPRQAGGVRWPRPLLGRRVVEMELQL